MKNNERELNVSFNKSGNGNYTPRIILPIAWIKEMGLDLENRRVKAIFENGEIKIKKLD